MLISLNVDSNSESAHAHVTHTIIICFPASIAVVLTFFAIANWQVNFAHSAIWNRATAYTGKELPRPVCYVVSMSYYTYTPSTSKRTRAPYVTVRFCMTRLAGSIQLLLVGVQEVHCVLENDICFCFSCWSCLGVIHRVFQVHLVRP